MKTTVATVIRRLSGDNIVASRVVPRIRPSRFYGTAFLLGKGGVEMRIAYDAPLNDEVKEHLLASGADLLAVPEEVSWAEVAQCDGLIYSAEMPLPEILYAHPRRLSVVAMLGAENGSEHWREEAGRAGLLLLAPSRSEAASIADYAMLCILRAARQGTGEGEELAGKTLGILGFEEAGMALAQRAKAFGMKVLVWGEGLSRGKAVLYDVAHRDLVDLLVSADVVVSLEPLSEDRRGRFGKDEIQLLKPTATLIHLADSALLAMDEIERALDWGYLKDFWMDLPADQDALAKRLAPYLGERLTFQAAGNTRQARHARQREMAEDLLLALCGQPVDSVRNLPHLSSLERSRSLEACRLAHLLGAFLGERVQRVPRRLRLQLGGQVADLPRLELARYFLAAFARAIGEKDINGVSAPLWAKEKGLDIEWQIQREGADGILAEAAAMRGMLSVGGMLQRGEIFFNSLDAYHLTAAPTDHLLLIPHANRPGMVGKIGTLLGTRHINIRGMVLGQKNERDLALMWIMLDAAPDQTLLEEISALPSCWQAEYIALPPFSKRTGEYL